MSEVTGLEEILKNMEDKLGQARVNRISNKALKKQGERNKQIVKKYMASYIDSGKTHDLVISSGVKSNPKRVIHAMVLMCDLVEWENYRLQLMKFKRKHLER